MGTISLTRIATDMIIVRTRHLTTRCSGPVHRGYHIARRCANSGAVARPAEREALG